MSQWRLSVVAALVLSAACVFHRAEAHPGCPGEIELSKNPELSFCPTDGDPLFADGFCCDIVKDAELFLEHEGSGATGECAGLYKEVSGRAQPPAAPSNDLCHFRVHSSLQVNVRLLLAGLPRSSTISSDLEPSDSFLVENLGGRRCLGDTNSPTKVRKIN